MSIPAQLHIREATVADRGAIEKCLQLLQDFECVIEENRLTSEHVIEDYANQLFEECAAKKGAIFIAEVEAKIVGLVGVLGECDSGDILEKERSHAYITDLIVLPAYRRQGVAAQLMLTAERYAGEVGARQMRVGVLATNTAAHELYARLGYRDYELVLEKKIPAQTSEHSERD